MPEVPAGFLRPALADIVPYEPGKPVEEVQRELGLDRVVKLASNEGPFGPFPRALEALERTARELNRYPDGGAYRLRTALAERHGVKFDEIAIGAGADGLIDGISQATLDPGDQLVSGWPSFPSYDQAYFEYIDDPDYPDAVEDYFKAGRRVMVLRTFSKIYGLAGLRVGYGVAPADLVTALGKTRRAFDLTTPAQEAALASLDAPEELELRRRLNTEGRAELERIFGDAGYHVAGPAVGNFVFVDLGEDAQSFFSLLLQQGVIVRPLAGFGAPQGVRVTVGTPDEHAFLANALARVGTAAAAS